MWLFTQFGFFSATQSPKDSTKLQVRARVKADLVHLVRDLPGHDGKILETPGRDYPYRVICSREQCAVAVSKAILAVDYSNFKSRVTDKQGWGRHDLYSKVWSVMFNAEQKLQQDKQLASKFGAFGTTDLFEEDGRGGYFTRTSPKTVQIPSSSPAPSRSTTEAPLVRGTVAADIVLLCRQSPHTDRDLAVTLKRPLASTRRTRKTLSKAGILRAVGVDPETDAKRWELNGMLPAIERADGSPMCRGCGLVDPLPRARLCAVCTSCAKPSTPATTPKPKTTTPPRVTYTCRCPDCLCSLRTERPLDGQERCHLCSSGSHGGHGKRQPVICAKGRVNCKTVLVSQNELDSGRCGSCDSELRNNPKLIWTS